MCNFLFIISDHSNLYIFFFCGLKVFHLLRYQTAKIHTIQIPFKEVAEEMKMELPK